MSRSRRKTPIGGVTFSTSNKEFKRYEHSRERVAVRQWLLKDCEWAYPPHPKEYGNEWASPRDGKMYYGNPYHLNPFAGFWMRALGLTADDIIKQQVAEYKRYMRK